MIVFLDQTKLRLELSNSNSMILLSAPLGNEWCLTCRLKEMFRPFYWGVEFDNINFCVFLLSITLYGLIIKI